MEEELKKYITDEFSAVNERIEELESRIKKNIGLVNLELGKLEGVLIGLKIRREELLDALGLRDRNKESVYKGMEEQDGAEVTK